MSSGRKSRAEPTNSKRTSNREKTPVKSEQGTNDMHAHSIKEFLNDVPVEPMRAEYCRIKETDLTKYVLRFDAFAAKKKENRKFNRYHNVFPYDYNRIILETPVDGSDYLNGSYITGPKSHFSGKTKDPEAIEGSDLSKYSNINFLATQGPLPETSEQHWRAIYENDVDIVVMLTRVKEGDKEKCIAYWPELGLPIRYGPYEFVLNDESELRPGVIRRDFLMMDCETDDYYSDKEVIHLQYIEWPDYGVPQEMDHLLKTVNEVRDIISAQKGRREKFNILVHCSAGVGRTGSFFALYQLMEKVEEIVKSKNKTSKDNPGANALNANKDVINIYDTVLSLRSKRVEMVQSWEQYRYLYGSVVAYARQLSGLPPLVQNKTSKTT